MLIALGLPAGNDRGPRYLEQVLDALYQQRFQFILALGRHADTVTLYSRVPNCFTPSVEAQLRSAYPDLRLTHLPDDALDAPRGFRRFAAALYLRHDVYAIKTWPAFVDREERTLADPLAGLLATLADERLATSVSFRIRPASLLRRGLYRFRCWFDQPHHELHKPPAHLFTVTIQVTVGFPSGLWRVARRKRQEVVAAFGRFHAEPFARFRRVYLWPQPFLLSSQELATLWHPPLGTVRTDRLETAPYRRLEPPTIVAAREREWGTAVLGRADFHGRDDAIGIRLDDRRRHLWIVGKTGMGKSTLLENMVASDIVAGRGVAFIDPHGDSATSIAAGIPARRTNDVVLFEAWDHHAPLAFNPLDCGSTGERHLVASELVSTFQKVYGLDPSNAPRLLDILRNAVMALIEVPGTTLLSLSEMLGNHEYRASILARVADPFVRSYWLNEFGKWKPSDQTLAVASVQNKIRPFIMHPLLRGILGQPRNRLDLRTIMDEGRILIVDLSKGKIGEDASTLLGALLVTKLQLAAMSRANVPEKRRPDFFAYIDEFQNFATASFATILSEARKYRLSLTVANQYLDQMEEATLHAILGNVGSMLTFQVGARDAEVLAEQFGESVMPADLMGLPKYTAYVRLLMDGLPSRPFSVQTLDRQFTAEPARLRSIRSSSRHRYGKPVTVGASSEREHLFIR